MSEQTQPFLPDADSQKISDLMWQRFPYGVVLDADGQDGRRSRTAHAVAHLPGITLHAQKKPHTGTFLSDALGFPKP